MESRFTKGKSSLLERSLGRGRSEVALSAFALLFSEMVQYSQARVYSVSELQVRVTALTRQHQLTPTQARLSELGRHVGARSLDALVLRERPGRRDTRLLGALLFIKVNLWKALFGKEADKLEQANEDVKTYYIIEREPLINTFISVPRDNSSLNCASFTAGVVEAALAHAGFPARVTAHWHKGTTLMIRFDDAVVARDRALDTR